MLYSLAAFLTRTGSENVPKGLRRQLHNNVCYHRPANRERRNYTPRNNDESGLTRKKRRYFVLFQPSRGCWCRHRSMEIWRQKTSRWLQSSEATSNRFRSKSRAVDRWGGKTPLLPIGRFSSRRLCCTCCFHCGKALPEKDIARYSRHVIPVKLKVHKVCHGKSKMFRGITTLQAENREYYVKFLTDITNPVLGLMTRSFLSLQVVASLEPSKLNERLWITSWWQSMMWSISPLPMSQSIICELTSRQNVMIEPVPMIDVTIDWTGAGSSGEAFSRRKNWFIFHFF